MDVGVTINGNVIYNIYALTVYFSFSRYSAKSPAFVSETVYYKRGVSQQFTLPSFKIDFSEWKEEDVSIFSLFYYVYSPLKLESMLFFKVIDWTFLHY